VSHAVPDPKHSRTPTGDQLLAALDALQERIDGLEHELHHAQRLASLGTLAAIIAHELNNILTPVLNYAQLALHASDQPAQVDRALRKTVEGVRRAGRITEAVLGFAREGGDEPNACDVRAVIDDTLACLGRDVARDGIVLDLDAPGGLTAAIAPTPLQQVLLNLVLNGREAMLGGRGTLTISARRSTWNIADDTLIEGVEIVVRDTGKGIPADRLATLFEPFATSVRTDEERKQGAHRGVGLGLAVCRQLVEGAGGEIDCASTVGEGTAFTIRLPGPRD
jgi:signal transduction histidine kinase